MPVLPPLLLSQGSTPVVKLQLAPAPLPEPWQEFYHDQYKRNYYYNPLTKVSVWVRPKATSTKLPPSVKSRNETVPDDVSRRPVDRRATAPDDMISPSSIKPCTQTFPVSPKRSPRIAHRERVRDGPPAAIPSNGHNTGVVRGNEQATPSLVVRQKELPALPPRSPERVHARSSPAARDLPPLPPKNSNTLPPLPPKEREEFAGPNRNSAPNLPPKLPPKEDSVRQLPKLPPKEERSLPPLPPKEDRPCPPLPPKEEALVPPATGTDRTKKKKRIVEYEDCFPQHDNHHSPSHNAPPQLPSKVPPPRLPEKNPGGPITNGTSPAEPPPPPPIPAINIPSPPPPPPPGLPPPPSPNVSAMRRQTSPRQTNPNSSPSLGGGRPFTAGDLAQAKTFLRKGEDSPVGPRRQGSSSGNELVDVFTRSLDSRMNSIRAATCPHSSDEESEFEDVDDEEWD